jgi:hypothetical protein
MHQPSETLIKGPLSPHPLKTASKTRGNLAATLDPQLRPRRSAGAIGRPKGARNYEWTPEIDRLLAELCAERAPSAKRTVGRPIVGARGVTSVPTPDSLRKAVEHRMATAYGQ